MPTQEDILLHEMQKNLSLIVHDNLRQLQNSGIDISLDHFALVLSAVIINVLTTFEQQEDLDSFLIELAKRTKFAEYMLKTGQVKHEYRAVNKGTKV